MEACFVLEIEAGEGSRVNGASDGVKMIESDDSAVANVNGDWRYGQLRCDVHQIADTCNEYALKGWELVAILPVYEDPHLHHLVMRRRAITQDTAEVFD